MVPTAFASFDPLDLSRGMGGTHFWLTSQLSRQSYILKMRSTPSFYAKLLDFLAKEESGQSGKRNRNRFGAHQEISKSPKNAQNPMAIPPATEVKTSEIVIMTFELSLFRVFPAMPVSDARMSRGKKDQFQAWTSGFS